MDQCITGRQLCGLLKINYDEIIRIRTNDRQDNLAYFIESLPSIPNIYHMIKIEFNAYMCIIPIFFFIKLKLKMI